MSNRTFGVLFQKRPITSCIIPKAKQKRLYLGKGHHEAQRTGELALRSEPRPSNGKVKGVKGEDPDVNGEHHVRSRWTKAVVDPILLGVGHTVEE